MVMNKECGDDERDISTGSVIFSSLNKITNDSRVIKI